eukprot:939872-Rhodomonas_salina.1
MSVPHAAQHDKHTLDQYRTWPSACVAAYATSVPVRDVSTGHGVVAHSTGHGVAAYATSVPDMAWGATRSA